MSVGIFLGVRAGFPEEDADAYLEELRAILAAAGLPDYDESVTAAEARARYSKLHSAARCAYDTVGSSLRWLAREVVAKRGARDAGPFADFAETTDRIFVPGEFSRALDAPSLPGETVWSLGALRTALRGAALTLGLPLVNGAVPADVFRRIDGFKKLGKHDSATDEPDEHGFSVLEHHRPTWLSLNEFCRVAHENQIALVPSS